MSSSCSAAGQQSVRAARGGLPRPRRPSSRPTPGPGAGGGSEAAWGRAGCNWWGAAGAGGQQAAAVATPRRQACSSRGSGGRGRVPTGNRDLVRRALSPPAAATGGRGAALRRWSFRPTPSRLRDASCSFSSPACTRPS
ncbi:circumsporozoite protein [Brachypodium distachyon]|uniref:circumsporozoite protein n=1 Tax=Brachypodium distachyon TaxID=15368 RepID=UPI000234EB56|nr:circumsporozoite protein [Brachypodium distachyon]|eukprot:XP_010236850.1 circumsporozoite protein [Brachypodium distachyon]